MSDKEVGSEIRQAMGSDGGGAVAVGTMEVIEESARVTVARGDDVTPELLRELRPHVIDLSQGHLSDGGRFSNTAGDVTAIFDEHLPAALDEARRDGAEQLRVVFYAHGGLVSETNALLTAHKHVQWWKQNRELNGNQNSKKSYSTYPIYFVWETGFFETVRQLLSRIRVQAQRGVRDIFDFTTDPIIELAARALQGPTIWGGMKFSAREACEEGGGAVLTAEALARFCAGPGAGRVILDAVGHSAGAIFHAHFVPMAVRAGAPRFRRAYFMAPAVRVDTFRDRLLARIGNAAADPVLDELVVFTMYKDVERADNCAQIYRKSLLYLIYYALEREARTAILGLEDSIRGDAELRQLFRLAGAGGPGEIVWSPSKVASGRRASLSTSHGGFDDDQATMNSILRRVCDLDDDDPIVPFPPPAARGLDEWTGQVDWPDELAFLGEPAAEESAVPFGTGRAPARQGVPAPGGGRRRALCVGINEYPTAPLDGCVADAELWARTLAALGFPAPRTLLNRQATREAILRELRALISSSGPGDVVVFQFAGHGTEAPDVSGDEAGGDTPDLDEAICPFDFASGRLLIDDDLAELFAATPAGVCVTCFIDCCHSGTITRFAVGGPTGGFNGEKERFVKLTPAQQEAHVQFRLGIGGSRASAARGPEEMSEVVFSACLSQEVALESNGQGHFTLRATRVLQQGADGVTNAGFQERVVQAFGPAPRQHPNLDCAPDARNRLLFRAGGRPVGGIGSPGPAASGGATGSAVSQDSGALGAVAQALRAAAEALEHR